MTDDHKKLVEILRWVSESINDERNQAAAAIESLSERVERAEADAERYRWLRTPHDDGLGGNSYPFAIDRPRDWEDENSMFGEELDADIDAARRKETDSAKPT